MDCQNEKRCDVALAECSEMPAVWTVISRNCASDYSAQRRFSDACIPRNRLFDGLARDQKETDALVPGLNSDLITAVEDHQRVIADVLHGRGSGFSCLLRQNRARF